MNILFPKLNIQLLPRMLSITLLGALISGVYGIFHDQITYSISQEYFTKLKFHQFQYANLGLPPRFYVSEIGFLATWWVGFFSGWFLARIAVPTWTLAVAVRRCLVGFSFIFLSAMFAGAAGYVLGLVHSEDYSYWQKMCSSLGVIDIPSFVRVAYIHNAGYLGGLIGLLVSIVFLHRLKKTEKALCSTDSG